MTNEPKSPLFSSVDELHEALVGYAKEALEATIAEDKRMGYRVGDLVDDKIRSRFDEHAKERMAQIAQALWMEREGAIQDARGESLVVDKKPLSSVEEAIYGAAFVGCASTLTVRTTEQDHYGRDLTKTVPLLGTNPDGHGATIAIDEAIRAVRHFRAAGGGR